MIRYLDVLMVQTLKMVNDVLLAKMDVSMQHVYRPKEKLVVGLAGLLVGE